MLQGFEPRWMMWRKKPVLGVRESPIMIWTDIE